MLALYTWPRPILLDMDAYYVVYSELNWPRMSDEEYFREDREEHDSLRGFFGDIVASFTEPGVNRGLVLLMHVVFLCLALTLLFTLYLNNWHNIHCWVLLAITLTLHIIMSWFVAELALALRIQKKLNFAQVEDNVKTDHLTADSIDASKGNQNASLLKKDS